MRQEDCEFEARLGYTANPVSKNKNKKKRKEKNKETKKSLI
jgi:hypothetical protein